MTPSPDERRPVPPAASVPPRPDWNDEDTDAASPGEAAATDRTLSGSEDPPPPAPPSEPPKKLKASRRSIIIMAIVGVIGVLVILWAWRLWPFTTTRVTTENSYVRGQITVMAPQVAGYVTEVLVQDFQAVKAGQPLIRIDDRIYRQRVAQSQAQLASAVAQLDNNVQTLAQDRATLESRRADLGAAQAERVRAGADEVRVDELVAKGSVSVREQDQIRAGARSAGAEVLKARAAIAIAEETVKATAVAREGLEADVAAARAQLDLARIDLANTIIAAPRDGHVGEASVRAGQYVAAGSQLLFLVPEMLWVVANYKETQVRDMRPGQPAQLRVDSLGGAPLRGRVERFAPATGSEFSVLRPDNASGNFTKVVQRVPVRIAIDPDQPRLALLRPGLSVVTTVDTAGGRDADAATDRTR
jgi:multidrug resistance efflux pump